MSIASSNIGKETLKWDVFLSYAREDRERVAAPLHKAMAEAGINCWYDAEEILAGDTTLAKINEGLRVARYVLVVLSLNFLNKHYPLFETLMSLNEEASTGQVKVIPLLYGEQSEREEILGRFPVLRGKRFLPWNDNPQEVVDALRKRLSSVVSEPMGGQPEKPLPPAPSARAPRVRSWLKYLLLLGAVVVFAALLLFKSAALVNDRTGPRREDYLPEMALIEGGTFRMGMSSDEARQLGSSSEDSTPEHDVSVRPFYISKTEVTNRQYGEFLTQTNGSGRMSSSGPNGPVTNVSWFEAKAYCDWLSSKTGKRYRLPTEAEWEKAARGDKGRRFPWGDEDADPVHANFNKSGACVAPVGSSPLGATPEGLLDMAGNVAEWCGDWYDPTYYYQSRESVNSDPKGPEKAGGEKVARGGSCSDNVYFLHCAARFYHPPDTKRPDLGFRVVRESER